MKKVFVMAIVILLAVGTMPIFAESVFQGLANSIEGTSAAKAPAAKTAAAPAKGASQAAPAGTGFSATSVFQQSADTVNQMGTDASSARSSSLRGNPEELAKRNQAKKGLNP